MKTIQQAVNELVMMPPGSTIEIPRNGGIWYVFKDDKGIWSQRRDKYGALHEPNRETSQFSMVGK